MRHSLFKLFGSVRLFQEVSRSKQSSSTEANHLLNELSLNNTVNNSTNAVAMTRSSPLNENKLDYINLNPSFSNLQVKPTQNIINQFKVTPNENIISNQKQMYIQPTLQPLFHQQLSCWSATQPIPISFTTFSTPSVLSYKPRDIRNFFLSPTKKTHTRRHPKHTCQDRRSRQKVSPKFEMNKSQMVLSLWPLPPLSFYLALLSIVLSSLNALGWIDLSYSAPSYVIYRLDFKNLFFSPFLFDIHLASLALAVWNFLILSLFEISLSPTVGGLKPFMVLFASLFFLVLGIRNLLGFVFSKVIGWAFPLLFFSNSMHEFNKGLSPFLFSLLVIQSVCIDDKYILVYGQDDSKHQWEVNKVILQLLMCLLNFSQGNIYWWSLSGLLAGLALNVMMQLKSAHDETKEFRPHSIPLWRVLWQTLKKSFRVISYSLPCLMFLNAYYNHQPLVTATELSSLSSDPYLFTFVFMTAPRRGDPAYLTQTLSSYLAHWPEQPEPESPYSRLQVMVYTHFSNHSQYDHAKAYFDNTVKGQRYLRWVREAGGEMNQRLHVAKALELATQNNSTYYALMEDDFPVCGQLEWRQIETIIHKAVKTVPQHCGVFVGTGGSGLFLKPEIAKLTPFLLFKYEDMPPDIIIQKCLMGELEECSSCENNLVISKTLLMYHIGYNTSTSDDRVYKEDEFQCKWRHPFNGDPSVVTL